VGATQIDHDTGGRAKPPTPGGLGPPSGLVAPSGTCYTIQVVAAHGSWINPTLLSGLAGTRAGNCNSKSLH
jgi:hypothetical protein